MSHVVRFPFQLNLNFRNFINENGSRIKNQESRIKLQESRIKLRSSFKQLYIDRIFEVKDSSAHLQKQTSSTLNFKYPTCIGIEVFAASSFNDQGCAYRKYVAKPSNRPCSEAQPCLKLSS
ncbi:unnamed protein product [Ambrosiozyma monospora]|uniref:Unnamed protein product n=1 Tax=Ambrosiozyma monospora TaxID=43982 RepID=A0A9W6Z4V5_AMBMO|nr:unnamed protein product [Ambrosiozyma monospora]